MILRTHWTFYGILLQVALLITVADSNLVRPKPSKDKFKCYVCFWAQNDEPCGDFNFTLAPAEAGKYMVHCLACYKQSFYANNGEKLKVLRGCAQELPYYALSCQQVYNQDGSYMETCACTTEYCNGALRPNEPWILPLLGLSWLLRKYS